VLYILSNDTMSVRNLVDTVMHAGVDVLQVFISTSAIFGIGFNWINFNQKVFKTFRNLAAAPFYFTYDEDEEEE